MYWLNNKFNIIAIIVGVLSIFTILINQSLEREYVQMSPKLEQIVHEKVSSLKKSVVDAIKGKTYQGRTEAKIVKSDGTNQTNWFSSECIRDYFYCNFIYST